METMTATRGGFRLYELPEVMRDIIERSVDHETGEIDAVLEMQLEGLQEDFTRKAEWIAMLAREATAEEAAYAMECDRLAKRQKACKNRADRLKNYLGACMGRAGLERVQGQLLTVRLQDNPPSIRWTGNPDEIPEAYRRVSINPDIAKLKDDMKAGAPLPEGFERTVGRSVRIA